MAFFDVYTWNTQSIRLTTFLLLERIHQTLLQWHTAQTFMSSYENLIGIGNSVDFRSLSLQNQMV